MTIKKDRSGIYSLIESLKWNYGSLFSFSVVINFLMLTPAWYMLQVYDRVLTSYDDNTLFGLSLIVVFLYIIYALMERYRGYLLVGVAEKFEEKITPHLYFSILGADRQFSFNNKKNNIDNLNTVKQFLTGQAILSILDVPWIPIYLIGIGLLNPSLGLVALVSVILLFGIATLSQQAINPKIQEAAKSQSKERRLIANISASTESIQILGMRNAFTKRLNSIRKDYLANLIAASIQGVNYSAVSKFLKIFIQSLVLGYGAYLAIYHEMTAGMIIASTILLGRALAPIDGVINAWRQLADFRGAYSSLKEVLNLQINKSNSVDLGRPQGKIELIGVTLCLRPEGNSTLDQINLTIEAGEVVAIIGPSGAGKTSLLKVLCGIYQPTKGRVLIDGADLAFRDLDSLGKHTGYLSQTTELLFGKVSENISRFEDVDGVAVLKAAKMSGAHEAIISLPEGYETVLGDYGHGLSEGQKRKIGLSRAVYNDPAMVFLDEPTSGLDDKSTLLIFELVRTLKAQGITLVFTTHQPSFARFADKIVLLVDGQIQMNGNSDDILKAVSPRLAKS
jgi:ATP-binding cassette subfamily C exporter for protease/lipase